MAKKILALILYVQVLLTASFAWGEPKNVIFLIGDGMGFEQVEAAGMYKYGYEYGKKAVLLFESFPYSGKVITVSANSSVTDSAAAATAMATGSKVNNGVISMAIPGDNSELETLLEHFKDRGRSTGLVTTTFMTHATPAAFGAHESSRSYYNEIAQDYLQQTTPNVLFGGGANGMSISGAESVGYTVVIDNTSLQALNTETEMVSGQFGTSHMPYEYDYFIGSDSGYNFLPHLSEMTEVALDILDNDPDGFFLMVESGRIDHSGHENNIQRNVFETLEFENTVQTVMEWAQGRSDTLILVTADHETGGLTVEKNNGSGKFPTVSWSTTGHTGVNVPIYATGENAHLVTGVMDNTELYAVATWTSNVPFDYYCDDDNDSYVSSAVSGTCEVIGCELPAGCQISSGDDCDDSAGAIHPGAPEDCTDGLDNDCDGLADVDDPDAVNCPIICTDADGDNYAVEGGDCGRVDCDDSDPAINPEACDIKNDDIDQDCNGVDRIRGSACKGSVDKEICDDRFDNDGDGKTDCDDRKDCGKDPFCKRRR